jgi:ketopantoate reductase
VAKKISLSADILDNSVKKAQMFPRDTQTSLQRDIKQKKEKNELDLFGRTIIDQGMRLNVPTPVTKKIYGELLESI